MGARTTHRRHQGSVRAGGAARAHARAGASRGPSRCAAMHRRGGELLKLLRRPFHLILGGRAVHCGALPALLPAPGRTAGCRTAARRGPACWPVGCIPFSLLHQRAAAPPHKHSKRQVASWRLPKLQRGHREARAAGGCTARGLEKLVSPAELEVWPRELESSGAWPAADAALCQGSAQPGGTKPASSSCSSCRRRTTRCGGSSAPEGVRLRVAGCGAEERPLAGPPIGPLPHYCN